MKQKKLVKLISVMLTLALFVTMIAGCNKTESEDQEETTNNLKTESTQEKTEESNKPDSWISDEPIELSMLYSEDTAIPFNQDWLYLKEVEERTNVKLEIITVPSTDYDDRIQLEMSSGQAPDLLSKTSPEKIQSFIPSGVLLCISDYIDKLPNLQKKIDDWDMSMEINDMKALDGKLYLLPGFERDIIQKLSVAYRKDIFDKNDIPEPQSWQELFDGLKQLKEIYPDSIPFSEKFEMNLMLSVISPAFETEAGKWAVPHGYSYDVETDSWIHSPTTDNYKELMIFLAKMVQDGLLDVESFTQNAANLKQKLFNDKTFASCAKLQQMPEYERETRKVLGEDCGVDWEMLTPLAGPTGIRATKSASRKDLGTAISSHVTKRKDFDKILKFLDWLYYSDEGITLSSWGVEDVTYKVVDGEKKLMDDIFNWDHPDQDKYLPKDFGVHVRGFYVITDPARRLDEYSADDREFIQTMIEGNMVPKDDPVLKPTTEQNEEMSLLQSTLTDYVETYIQKFILGEVDVEEGWDDYVAECDKKGRKELMEIVNEVWKSQNK